MEPGRWLLATEKAWLSKFFKLAVPCWKLLPVMDLTTTIQLLTEKSNLQIDTLEYSSGRYHMHDCRVAKWSEIPSFVM